MGRVSSAAEELRSNFAHWSPFENAGPGSGPTPRPRPPPSPRGPGRPAPSARRRVVAPAAPDVTEKHEEAWTRLEAFLEHRSGPIHFADIPWPPPSGMLGGITGVLPGDSAAVAKRRLVAALRRWHPDKWRRILDRVPEQEQNRVMEQVKNIAQRLLDEKAKLTGPGGVLH